MSNHGHGYRFIIWKIQRVDGGHKYIGHRINAEVNYVKVGWYVNHGFGDWTRVFMWWILGEKVGKFQTTFLQLDIINARHIFQSEFQQ